MRTKKVKGGATVLIMTVVISGALTSILGARQLQRMTTEPQWVASVDLTVGEIISRNDISEIRAEMDERSIKSPGQLIGKILTEDKQAGSPFYMTDITAPSRSWLAQKVPEGRVLYTLVPHNNTIPHTLLRNGDRFDVLVTGRRGVRTVAQDVRLIGALAGGNSQQEPEESGRSLITRLTAPSDDDDAEENQSSPLIIAVKPEEVYPLASIRKADVVSLVLHGETSVQAGELLDINPVTSSLHQIEIFSGLERKQVFTNY